MTSVARDTIRINFERLKADIESLSEIGREEDRGIYRMAFTEADMMARSWLADRMANAGLEPRSDGAANVFATVNQKPGVPTVMTGSHLDTVPAAGHLDGALGVLVALECLRCIHEEGIETEYPIEMVAFSDEEGRFGGLLGSQALCGEITPDGVHNAVDLNGVRLVDAMRDHGMDAMDVMRARRSPQSLHAFLEMHIEQGPVLDQSGIHIGVVESITGLFKWNIRFIGAADHAGTTPMEMRKDCLAGLAEFSGEIPRILEEHGREHSVATIGKVKLFPGTANTVPGTAEFSLDVRDTNQEALRDLSDAFRRALSAIARRRELMFEFDILSEVAPVDCDPAIIAQIAETAEELGVSHKRMPSGAAHDAQIMARLTRVGMVFIPSKGGRSHSPAEWSHWEDIHTGADVTLHTLLKIAQARI